MTADTHLAQALRRIIETDQVPHLRNFGAKPRHRVHSFSDGPCATIARAALAGQTVSDVEKALRRLIDAASEVHKLGARTGSQWLPLGIALSAARSALGAQTNEKQS